MLSTLVRYGASIGANATILCGHTIGAWAFVGAGSIVTKDVLQHELVYGSPARQHGYVCFCTRKLVDIHYVNDYTLAGWCEHCQEMCVFGKE